MFITEYLEPRRLLSAASTPFLGLPFNVVTDKIEAEDFDNGGEGISYHDTTPANLGGAYRNTGVDIAADSAASNGFSVGWTAPGEWMVYSINVPTSGTFTFSASVASYRQGGTFHMEVDGVNQTGPMTIPNTGPWDTWQTITSGTFSLSAGNHLMRIVMDKGGFWGPVIGDFDYFRFNVAQPAGPTPFHGSPFNISTDTIQAEDFDNGGEGVAYHLTTPQKITGLYRNTGVSIVDGHSGTYSVGYTGAGEWLDYTINVPTAGNYVLQASVANGAPGAAFHGEIDGTNVTGAITIPNTGGWFQYQTLQSSAFALSAGTHVLRIVMDRGDTWGAVGDFDYFKFNPPSGSSGLTQPLVWNSVAHPFEPLSEAWSIGVNGKFYMFGGYNVPTPMYEATNHAEVYDPATNTWSHLADMPQQLTHMGIATDGTSIYLAGGYVTDPKTGNQTFGTVNVWRYDIASNTYAAMPPLPQPRAAGALVLLGTELHYFDGVDPTRVGRTDHWVLNLASAAPSQQWVSSTPLPFSRNHINGAGLDGKIYAIGGQAGEDDGFPASDVLVWDPANPGSWQALANLPQPRTHSATVSVDGKLVVIGGETTGNVSLASVIVYDPTTNSWSSQTSLPAPRIALTAALVGNQIFVTTGFDGGYFHRDTWVANVT